KECKNIFGFLKRALMKTTFDHAFRGPKEYEEQDLLYQCHAEGTCSQFSGREVIFQKNKTVFIQQFIGGSIVHKLKS
ncbi:MAG: DUF5680 domain-containing protein, partial [Candidatus Woesearchaeota archaeon]|nr:DUF5680 domain-containing protein [Candidatus Woesearchaeota archaeon]